MSNAHALSSSDLFTQCGYALCGSGADWKSQFGQLLGGIKPDTIDSMTKGRTRIPPGVWTDIAVHLHDRAMLDLLALRDGAVRESLAPLARVYRVRNIEFSVEPSVDGRWPQLMITNKPFNQFGGSWWRPAGEYEFRLPDDTMSARLEFDGERGQPFMLTGSGPVPHPPSMKRASRSVAPSPADVDPGEIDEKAEKARQAWLEASRNAALFAAVMRGGRNPTREELEEPKRLKRIYDDLHKRRLAVHARRFDEHGVAAASRKLAAMLNAAQALPDEEWRALQKRFESFAANVAPGARLDREFCVVLPDSLDDKKHRQLEDWLRREATALMSER